MGTRTGEQNSAAATLDKPKRKAREKLVVRIMEKKGDGNSLYEIIGGEFGSDKEAIDHMTEEELIGDYQLIAWRRSVHLEEVKAIKVS